MKPSAKNYPSTRVNIYTKSAVENTNVIPGFAIDPLSNVKAWQDWQDKDTPNFLNVPNLFHEFQIDYIDYRGNGGRAYQVNIPLTINDKPIIIRADLREDQLLKILKTCTVQKDAIVTGNFMFERANVVIAPQMYINNFAQFDQDFTKNKQKNKYRNHYTKAQLRQGHIYTKIINKKEDDFYYYVVDMGLCIIQIPKNIINTQTDLVTQFTNYLKNILPQQQLTDSNIINPFPASMYEDIAELPYTTQRTISHNYHTNITNLLIDIFDEKTTPYSHEQINRLVNYTVTHWYEWPGNYDISTYKRIDQSAFNKAAVQFSKKYPNKYPSLTDNRHRFY